MCRVSFASCQKVLSGFWNFRLFRWSPCSLYIHLDCHECSAWDVSEPRLYSILWLVVHFFSLLFLSFLSFLFSLSLILILTLSLFLLCSLLCSQKYKYVTVKCLFFSLYLSLSIVLFCLTSVVSQIINNKFSLPNCLNKPVNSSSNTVSKTKGNAVSCSCEPSTGAWLRPGMPASCLGQRRHCSTNTGWEEKLDPQNQSDDEMVDEHVWQFWQSEMFDFLNRIQCINSSVRLLCQEMYCCHIDESTYQCSMHSSAQDTNASPTHSRNIS